MRSGACRLFISFKARNPGPASFEEELRVDSTQGRQIHIKYPEEYADQDVVEAFCGLSGDGFGEPNEYIIGINDGGIQNGVEARAKPLMIMVLLGVMVAACGM